MMLKKILFVYVLISIHIIQCAVYACPQNNSANERSCLAPDSFFRNEIKNYNLSDGSVTLKTDFASSQIREIEILEQGKIKKKIGIFPFKPFKENRKKHFLSPVKKVLLAVVFMFLLFPGTALSQSSNIADSTYRLQLEENFSESMRLPLIDLHRLDAYKRANEGSKQSYGFNSYVQGNAERAAEHVVDGLVAGINFDIHETLDRTLIKKDGSSSTVYHSIIEIGNRYGIDPYLLMTHTILERSDRSRIESFTDRLREQASKGNFQIRIQSLHNAIERIYERFPDAEERNSRFPLLEPYSTFAKFKSKFNVKKFLDLDETSEEEIELACLYLWDQFYDMQRMFPDVYSEAFMEQALRENPSFDDKNALILWTLAYTSNRAKYDGRSVAQVFRNSAYSQHGVYTWSRASSRIYQYVRSISEAYGYEGFQEDDFINIDENQTGRAIGIHLLIYDYIKWGMIFLSVVFGLGLLLRMRKGLEKAADILTGIRLYNKKKSAGNTSSLQQRLANQVVTKRKKTVDSKNVKRSEISVKKYGSLDLTQAVVNRKKKKDLRIILPGSLSIDAYNPGSDNKLLLEYLYELHDHIFIQIAESSVLQRQYPNALEESRPDIFRKVIFSLNDLEEIYGSYFTSGIRAFFLLEAKVNYISMEKLMDYLEDNSKSVRISGDTVRVAA